jgi:lysophospholipase L1-like esterase
VQAEYVTNRHTPANGGHTVRYEVNDQGFRGPALRPIQDGHARVLVYGDSFIQAEFTPLAQTFPVRLQEALLGAGAPHGLEVVNAGIAGYGPDQILRRMETELVQLKPRLVVVSIFSGNDFGDLLRTRLFRLDGEGKLERHAFQVDKRRLHQMRVSNNEPILRKLVRGAVEALRGPGATEGPFDRKTYIEQALAQHVEEYKTYVVDKSPFVGDFGVDPYTADLALQPDSASAIYRVKLMRQILARMKAVADQAGVHMVLMIVPHPMDLHDGDHESGWVDRAKYPQYDPRRLSGTLETLAAEMGVPAINLYAPFRAQENPSSLFLRGGDDHWNSQGQALAAEVAAPVVMQQGKLAVRH